MQSAKVWVVLPTYDEAPNIARIVPELLGVFARAEMDGHVLVVDDNSPDGTGAIADELARADPRVHVLHRHAKEGLGPAYLAGFAVALANGADRIVEMDADFSHDPAALPRLVAAAEHADLVLGSRYVRGGRVENWSLIRRLVSRGGCLYGRTILGIGVRDVTGGFKCFRRETLLALDLEAVSASGYGFQIELTHRAIQRGLRVLEVPIVFTERAAGRSKMTSRIVFEAMALVVRLRLERRDGAGTPAVRLGTLRKSE